MTASRPRRWSLVLGLLLLTSGLGVGAWLLWEVHGTTWVAERRQVQTLDELERQWSSGVDEVPVAGSSSDAVLRVPRFGEDWQVPLVQGTTDAALAAGVGVFDDAARPGGRGNLTLAGHRITHGEPFARLPELRAGDEVVVETRGRVHTYVLDIDAGALVVPFTETWVVDHRPRNPDPEGPGPAADSRRLITLTTCSELFHTDDRTVVFGHLVDSRPRVP